MSTIGGVSSVDINSIDLSSTLSSLSSNESYEELQLRALHCEFENSSAKRDNDINTRKQIAKNKLDITEEVIVIIDKKIKDFNVE